MPIGRISIELISSAHSSMKSPRSLTCRRASRLRARWAKISIISPTRSSTGTLQHQARQVGQSEHIPSDHHLGYNDHRTQPEGLTETRQAYLRACSRLRCCTPLKAALTTTLCTSSCRSAGQHLSCNRHACETHSDVWMQGSDEYVQGVGTRSLTQRAAASNPFKPCSFQGHATLQQAVL